MTVYGGTTTDKRVNDGGITDAHGATTVRYDACTVKPVAPWAPKIAYG